MLKTSNLQNYKVFLFLAVLLLPSSAAGQSVLEEIVVTAQKREQNLQDVGISVTAFSGAQLRALGLEDTVDLETQTPGLLIGEYGGAGATTTMNIRGVAQLDFSDHQESPNAVYVDGAYVSFIGGVNVSMFDLERVEVLRGPQGTLFGRNATGGLIHLVTKTPTDEFEAYADLTYAEYDKVRSEAAISGPFSDTVRGRLSFSSEHHEGYYENTGGEDIVENATINVRGQLDVDLSEQVNVLISARYSNTDNTNAGVYHQIGSAPNPANDGLSEKITDANRALLDEFCTGFNMIPTVTPPGGSDCYGSTETSDVFTVSPDTIGFFDREMFGVTATLAWQLNDAVTLTSITDYQTIDKSYLEDNDSTALPVTTFYQEQDADQVSQEIRLNGVTDKLQWVVGGYYLNIDSDSRQQVDQSPFFDINFYDDFNHETESWAVFGQAEYAVTEQLSVIGGLRWTEDEKKINLLNQCLDTDRFGFSAFGLAGTCDAFGLAFDTTTVGGRSDGDWAGKVELNLRPGDDLLLYAGVTRGNKGGTLNATVGAGAGVNIDSLQIRPEVLVNYEGGFKATFADGRARLNASVFYYDYEDYQAYNFVGVAVVLFNADAELYGGEVELQATPLEGLDLILGLAYLDSEVKGVVLPSGRLTKQDMPFAPEVSINGLARYEWPVFNGSLALQGDFNYVDSRYYSTINHPTLSDDDYFVVNARLTYTNQDDRWDASVFVNNLTNVERTLYAFDLSTAGGGYGIESYAPPRWVGGSIGYRWQ